MRLIFHYAGVSKEEETPYKLTYDRYWKIANSFAQEGNHRMAEVVIKIMIEKWPKRVIAVGKLASDVDIPNPKLD